MTDNQFNQTKEWFEDLRDQLLNIITEIDGNKFISETLVTHKSSNFKKKIELIKKMNDVDK